MMAKRTEELMDEKAALREQIDELQQEMAWSADTTMELSIAHLQTTQEMAALSQNNAQLEQELNQSRHRCHTLEADLATAGLLAAQGSVIYTEETEQSAKQNSEVTQLLEKQQELEKTLSEAHNRAAAESQMLSELRSS